MKHNEGRVDRVVRVGVGAILVLLAFLTSKTWLVALAIILLVTGILGVCPFYRVLGVDSCRGRA